MRTWRRKGIVAVAVAVGLTAAACSAGGSGAIASESNLAQVLNSHEIKIAVQCQAAPWGIQESDGSHQGYDIDIANALAEALGAKVSWTCTTNEARIPSLKANKVDVVIASFTATDTRAQQVAFTIPYAVSGTRLAVPKNSEIKSYADLPGKKVSASRGSLGATVLQSEFPKADLQLFNSFADSVQALRSGKVDALVENNVIVPDLVSQDPSLRVLAGPVLQPAFFGFGVKQGDPVWVNYLDNFIRNYGLSGQQEKSWQKWIKEPLPDFLKYVA